MAAVDASIGIKTAVNFHGRKNKMGTYCPPLAVFIYKTFLNTCGDRHLSNASAEILKMALIKDRELFELLEKHSKELITSKFQVIANFLLLSAFCMLFMQSANMSMFCTLNMHCSPVSC